MIFCTNNVYISQSNQFSCCEHASALQHSVCRIDHIKLRLAWRRKTSPVVWLISAFEAKENKKKSLIQPQPSSSSGGGFKSAQFLNSVSCFWFIELWQWSTVEYLVYLILLLRFDNRAYVLRPFKKCFGSNRHIFLCFILRILERCTGAFRLDKIINHSQILTPDKNVTRCPPIGGAGKTPRH